MQLNFDKNIVGRYKSRSQQARILTENWVDTQVFCPNCGHLEVDKYPNNRPVADFYCSNCREEFELKSKQGTIGKKIVDGAYLTMLERLTSSSNPNFFFLNYDLPSLEVTDFLIIPKHFFIPEIIEERKPLAITARRAGWVGCNILLQSIPQTGKIFFVKNGQIEAKEKILAEWQKTLFLREEKELSSKGWLLDVMKCIEKLGKREFTLEDTYMFERELGQLHPDNQHIKEKIRQQLQILRDKGYLDFVSRGYYRLM
ncbi:MAG: restriction endonuclease [Candidatus Andersenbacteria bacterium]|nr:restriction endonuclease [Candidatus Andersenbacteria bacterium]